MKGRNSLTDASSNSNTANIQGAIWSSNSPISESFKLTKDTTPPTITSVSSSTNNGSYKAGDAIAVTITFSENVTVSGTPQLTLETGASDAVVNYSSGSGGSVLTFNYTVGGGHNSADLNYQSTTALALNSGTIKDAAGYNATLTLPALNNSSSLAANKSLVIDTTAPTMTITAVNSSGTAVASDATTNDATPNFNLYSIGANYQLCCVGDITVSTGSLSNFNATSSTVYTATLSMNSNNSHSISVDANSFSDAAGNNNITGSPNLYFDGTNDYVDTGVNGEICQLVYL